MKQLALVILLGGCGRVAFDSGADGGLECPADFTRSGASCYRANHAALTGDGRSFVDAEALCEAQGGHLAVIDDADEAARITALGIPGTDYWLGLSELALPGVYRTVLNDVATYLPWDTSEPDGGVDHCAGIRVASGLIYDAVCTSLDDALCEYDGRQPVPAAWGQ